MEQEHQSERGRLGAGIALRAGRFGVGALLGIHQESAALMLGLAATLLVRSGILIWRVQPLKQVPAQAAAYGDHLPRSPRKERV